MSGGFVISQTCGYWAPSTDCGHLFHNLPHENEKKDSGDFSFQKSATALMFTAE